VFGALRLVSRAGLHYHETWPLVLDCVARGIRVGQQSEPYFMAKFDDVLHLTPEEARKAIGIRGAEDVDSAAATRIFREEVEPAESLAAE